LIWRLRRHHRIIHDPTLFSCLKNFICRLEFAINRRENNMPAYENHTTVPLGDGDGTPPAFSTAIAETYKALKAIAFYPEGHPLRGKILERAYQATVSLVRGGAVSLVVQRNGLSVANRDSAVDTSPAAVALARELFAREIQRLTLLPELSMADYAGFLSLLALEPQAIVGERGLAEMLTKRGIRTVISDEIDISAVFTRRQVGEAAEDAATERAAVQEAAEQEASPFEGDIPDQSHDFTLEELLDLMFVSAETDDNRYRQLARVLLSKGQALKVEGDFNRLYPVLFFLLDQHADVKRSDVRRSCSLTVFQQLSLGDMAEHLLDHLEEKDFGQQEFVHLILAELGSEVVDAVIRRIVAADSQHARNALASALLRVGPPALPALTGLLKEHRGEIVRTAVIILGEMGNRDAVKGLLLTAHHTDIRVRMESIRSLAKIGGSEATAELIALLKDENQAVRKQAIAWLGITRNQKALEPLIRLVMKRDPLGKRAEIRKEALVAIGHIGDRQAIDPLSRLAKKRYWLAPGRHLELQVLAVETIARLGGESSRDVLEKLAVRGGRIGRACTAALESIGQRTANSHE
jgi:HEAT repeats